MIEMIMYIIINLQLFDMFAVFVKVDEVLAWWKIYHARICLLSKVRNGWSCMNERNLLECRFC